MVGIVAHGSTAMRALCQRPCLALDPPPRTSRLRSGGDIQRDRVGGIRRSLRAQEGDGSGADAANRCRLRDRALPVGAIDAGPARHAPPAGGDRPVRAGPDQRAREVRSGGGEGPRQEARAPAGTATEVGQACAEGSPGRRRGAKLPLDRPQPRNQQEHRPRHREAAPAKPLA